MNQANMQIGKSQNKKQWNTFEKILVYTLFVILFTVIFGVSYLIYNSKTEQSVLGVASSSQPYQAVFLSNGQVYFGIIEDENDIQIQLNDVYFLRVNEQLDKASTDEQPDLTIIARENAIHAPTGDMQISKNFIIAIEELSTESKILEAIQTIKSQEN